MLSTVYHKSGSQISLENVESIELKPNQAALILEADDEGDISVEMAAREMDSLAAAVCKVIAQKLSYDEKFQAEILDALEEEDTD